MRRGYSVQILGYREMFHLTLQNRQMQINVVRTKDGAQSRCCCADGTGLYGRTFRTPLTKLATPERSPHLRSLGPHLHPPRTSQGRGRHHSPHRARCRRGGSRGRSHPPRSRCSAVVPARGRRAAPRAQSCAAAAGIAPRPAAPTPARPRRPASVRGRCTPTRFGSALCGAAARGSAGAPPWPRRRARLTESSPASPSHHV